MVKQQLHTGRLQVIDAAMGELAPVRHLAGDVVRDAANAEVGIAVGDQDRHVSARVELAGTASRFDACVAAPDDDQPHDRLLPRGRPVA